ncbi:MAG: MarR family transcriptional regulator [Myxococcota bacterium]
MASAHDNGGTRPKGGKSGPEGQGYWSRNAADLDGASDALTRRVLDVCEATGAFIEYWGFKGILGRVWALLALRAEPLSQTEIAQLLGVSRSLVSGAVAELQRRGLVRAMNDHRNAPYEAVIDVWPSIAEVLRSREWMLIESARLALDAAIEEAELHSMNGEPVLYDVGRMRMLLLMTETAQGFLKALIAMRGARPVESLTNWVSRASELMSSLRGRVTG